MNFNGDLTVMDSGKITDITPKELIQINEFKEAGMPGLAATNEVTMTKALDLYMAGKSYHEISQTLATKKALILFLAQKFDWYGSKCEHLAILDANIKERIIHAKLVNQDFMLQIQSFFLKKIGRKMTRFMATNDDDAAAAVDRKDIELYFKSVALLRDIESEKVPTNGQRPTIGLNMGDGVTIKKVGENEVTITPRSRTNGEMLAELANMKREEEQKAQNAVRDIPNEEVKNTEGNEE